MSVVSSQTAKVNATGSPPSGISIRSATASVVSMVSRPLKVIIARVAAILSRRTRAVSRSLSMVAVPVARTIPAPLSTASRTPARLLNFAPPPKVTGMFRLSILVVVPPMPSMMKKSNTSMEDSRSTALEDRATESGTTSRSARMVSGLMAATTVATTSATSSRGLITSECVPGLSSVTLAAGKLNVALLLLTTPISRNQILKVRMTSWSGVASP